MTHKSLLALTVLLLFLTSCAELEHKPTPEKPCTEVRPEQCP